jgi:hypothetical protein
MSIMSSTAQPIDGESSDCTIRYYTYMHIVRNQYLDTREAMLEDWPNLLPSAGMKKIETISLTPSNL